MADTGAKVDNHKRADWAMQACHAFCDCTGQNTDDEMPDVVTDLLADLMHLCDQMEVDYAHCARKAGDHYAAEKEEE